MILFLVACSGTENPASHSRAEDEADIGFMASQSSGGGFCETLDTYYYVDRSQNGTGSMIYFVDKQTGFNGALCSKPECSHDSSDCNADAPKCMGLSVYDGRLWWIGAKTYDSGSWAIFSSEPDGTGRKAEREIDAFNYRRDKIPDNYGYVTSAFHKGYLYLSYTSSVVENGVPCEYIAVTKTPLSTNGETEEILYERVENSFSAAISLLTAGDKLYFYTLVYHSQSGDKSDFKVYEYGEEGLSELYSLVDEKPTLIPYSFGISPDEQVVFSYRNIVYALGNGKFEESHSFKDYGAVYFAKNRIVAINPGNMVNKTVSFCVVDYKFKALSECSFNIADLIEEPDATSYFCSYQGIGMDAVVFRCEYFKSADFAAGNSGSVTNQYYISAPISGGKAKVLSESQQ